LLPGAGRGDLRFNEVGEADADVVEVDDAIE
jgi:hypothetical protein